MNDYLENDYRDTYLAWKNGGNPANRSALLKQLHPVLAQSIIAAGGDPNNPVMYAKAKLLALQGLTKYDPSKATLKNYMYSHMRGLNRVLGLADNIIQTPESVVLDRKRASAVEKGLIDELGRFPSSYEIADRAGLTLKRLAKVRQASVPVTEQQVDTVMGGNAPPVRIIGDTTKQDAWLDYVYDSVDSRQQAIMERLYGMHGFDKTPAKDVAKQLKITPAAISQQRKKIDKLLNSELSIAAFGLENE